MRAIALLFAVSGFLSVAEAFSVYRSENQGRSWERTGSGLPGDARVNGFGAVGGSILAATDAGVFWSLDQGRKWRAASGPRRTLALASQGKTAFAGTATQGVWASTDDGRTWRRLTGFEGLNVRSLVADGPRLYAGGDKGGVFLSTDGGQVWAGVSGGLPANGQVFALAVVRGQLFAGLYANGLYVWDGMRWTTTGEVRPLVLAASGDMLVLGHNPGGLLWSVTTGDYPHARMGSLSAEAPVWALSSGASQVFAGAAAGIYFSNDGGRSWAHAREGLPENHPGIAFLVTDRYVLAAAVGAR